MWDPRFATRPVFWAIAEPAALFAAEDTFPTPERIDDLLAPRAGIRFVRAEPRPKRRARARARAAQEESALYDTRIVEAGEVPTRNGSWHDLLNALVWAAFPVAKRALHTRQRRLVVPAQPGEARRRPRALDALALFDEGGVVLLDGGARLAVFGHAIYEGLVEGWPSPTASALAVSDPTRIDASLAAILADEAAFADPSVLTRVELSEGAVRTAPNPLTD